MSDQNGAGPGAPVKHTGDPSQVRVTVPPGSPAVSAPQTVTPDQAAQVPPPTAAAAQAPPQGPQVASHFGQDTANAQWAGQAPAGTHPEVVGLDVLMELHAQQARTQKIMVTAVVVMAAIAVVIVVGRARGELVEVEPA